MPIYEWECKRCGFREEVLTSFPETSKAVGMEPTRWCKKCEGFYMRMIPSKPGKRWRYNDR